VHALFLIGKWVDFSSAQVVNLGITHRPSPTVSEPTKSNIP